MSHPKTDNGHWYACDYPERPPDSRLQFDAKCRACVVALGAYAATLPPTLYQARWRHRFGEQRMRLDAMYEEARQRHGLPPLPKECHERRVSDTNPSAAGRPDAERRAPALPASTLDDFLGR